MTQKRFSLALLKSTFWMMNTSKGNEFYFGDVIYNCCCWSICALFMDLGKFSCQFVQISLWQHLINFSVTISITAKISRIPSIKLPSQLAHILNLNSTVLFYFLTKYKKENNFPRQFKHIGRIFCSQIGGMGRKEHRIALKMWAEARDIVWMQIL